MPSAEKDAGVTDLLAALQRSIDAARADAKAREGRPCSCAMTEASQRRCPQHGEDQYRVIPPAEGDQ